MKINEMVVNCDDVERVFSVFRWQGWKFMLDDFAADSCLLSLSIMRWRELVSFEVLASSSFLCAILRVLLLFRN